MSALAGAVPGRGVVAFDRPGDADRSARHDGRRRRGRQLRMEADGAGARRSSARRRVAPHLEPGAALRALLPGRRQRARRPRPAGAAVRAGVLVEEAPDGRPRDRSPALAPGRHLGDRLRRRLLQGDRQRARGRSRHAHRRRDQLGIIPLSLAAVYRADLLRTRLGSPLVPYAKLGLGCALWSVNDTSAQALALGQYAGLERRRRCQPGFVIHRSRRAAHTMDMETGVNQIAIFFEVRSQRSDGFGSSSVLRVGDTTWLGGLMLEM